VGDPHSHIFAITLKRIELTLLAHNNIRDLLLVRMSLFQYSLG
jgi:hypothetical protein